MQVSMSGFLPTSFFWPSLFPGLDSLLLMRFPFFPNTFPFLFQLNLQEAMLWPLLIPAAPLLSEGNWAHPIDKKETMFVSKSESPIIITFLSVCVFYQRGLLVQANAVYGTISIENCWPVCPFWVPQEQFLLDNVCLFESKVMGSVSDFIFGLHWIKCLLALWVIELSGSETRRVSGLIIWTVVIYLIISLAVVLRSETNAF